MYLAKVTGTVVATRKVDGLEGVRLLLVEPVDENGRPVGKPAVATDAVRAGPGELVYVCTGREASMALDETFVPVDLCVVGHVDDVHVDDEYAVTPIDGGRAAGVPVDGAPVDDSADDAPPKKRPSSPRRRKPPRKGR